MTEFNPRHFLWRQEGRVGIITLNRPQKKNPLTFESYAELRDLFRALADKNNHRALADTSNHGALADSSNSGSVAGKNDLRELAQGDDIRSIVLTGAGDNFCSGGD